MEIAIIDIETTGFSVEYDFIVEVGIVLLDLENGNVRPLINFVTNENGITEDKLRKSWVINNTSLTVEEVRYGVNLKYITKAIQHITNTYPITAFNRKFDIGFLEARRINCPNLYADPMLELTNIIKLPGKNGNYKWPSAQEAYKYFFPNDGYIEIHRALDDAMHEAKIIYELNKLKNK